MDSTQHSPKSKENIGRKKRENRINSDLNSIFSVIQRNRHHDLFIRDPIIILLLRIILYSDFVITIHFIFALKISKQNQHCLRILFLCFNRIGVMCFVPSCCVFVSFATASCKFLFHFTGKTVPNKCFHLMGKQVYSEFRE